MPDGTNEIPVARTLLENLNMDSKLTLADAAHTQTQTARTVLFGGGGDYLLTVKENQKELCQTLAHSAPRAEFFPLHRPRRPGPTPGNGTGNAGKSAS